MSNRIIIEDWPCDHSWSADKGEQCYADVTDAPAVSLLLKEAETLRRELATAKELLDVAATGNRSLVEDVDWWKTIHAEAQRAGNALYDTIRKAVEPHFPKGSRDLDWDVIPGTLGRVAAERKEASESRDVLAAALRTIMNARDTMAEGEDAPYNTEEQGFDDWAADQVSAALRAAGVSLYPPCPKCGGVTHQCETGDEGCLHCDACGWMKAPGEPHEA
jgi:hypothetical protein